MNLEEKIEEADKHYWETGENFVSDEVYEGWRNQLRRINPNNSVLTKVWGPVVSSLGKIKHTVPMLSLDKAYSAVEILKFINKVSRGPEEEFRFSPKADGSAAKRYRGGVLATRGHGGIEGENISDKIPLIHMIGGGPLSMVPKNKELVGELVMLKSVFEKGGYTSIRNAVAGLLNRDNIIGSEEGVITFVTYDAYSMVEKSGSINEELISQYQEMCKDLPYETDGSVISLVDTEYAESLGSTSHHPRHSMAFKHVNCGEIVRSTGFELQVGKRKLTPVVHYEPTMIGGAVCSKATMHNWKNVMDRGFRIGDDLSVERAGGVIPKVVEVICNEGYSEVCEYGVCPSCGSDTEYRAPELYCTNDECPEMLVQRLAFVCKTLDIKNVSAATIRQLGVSGIFDMYFLTVGDLVGLDRWGEKSASNFIAELDRVRRKEIEDWKIIKCLCIEGIGASVGKIILNKYNWDDAFTVSSDDLMVLDGIGKVIADRFVKERSVEEWQSLVEHFNVTCSSDGGVKSEVGKSICFTGKFPENKRIYQSMCTEWSIATSVTKELNLLVIPTVGFESSKVKKATKYGVKIITLEEFLDDK